jgi:hypothetical protein
LIFYSVWEWIAPGMAGKYLTGLVTTNAGRGILFMIFGFFTLAFGLIRLISGSAHSSEQRSAWVDLGFRIQGLIGSVIGILLLLAGGWLYIK